MNLRLLVAAVGLFAIVGCVEVQRTLRGEAAVGDRESDWGPVSGNGEDGAVGGIPELPDDLEEVTTETGLRYIDIEVGTGAQPETGDDIEAHYTGWLEEDGTKFDSSLDRGEPFSFTLDVSSVIQGWHEGFATMQEGGRRRLIIPPELAYGAAGRPPSIPGNATLIFDVELLAVNPQ